MQTYRSVYEHELSKLLHREIENAKNTLSEGYVADFSAYKEQTGFIRGLRLAFELMAEADRICQGGERDT